MLRRTVLAASALAVSTPVRSAQAASVWVEFRGGVYRGGVYRGGVAYRGGAYRGAWVRPGVGIGLGAAAAGVAIGAAAANPYNNLYNYNTGYYNNGYYNSDYYNAIGVRCGYAPYPPCY